MVKLKWDKKTSKKRGKHQIIWNDGMEVSYNGYFTLISHLHSAFQCTDSVCNKLKHLFANTKIAFHTLRGSNEGLRHSGARLNVRESRAKF